MKRLFLIVISILLLGIMGYFATQNNHIVTLNLFEKFSIEISVWIVVAGSFVFGWALTELWQFISHPNRFVQSFLGKFSQYREEKKHQLTQNFEKASLLRDSKNVRKNFNKLNNRQIPLSIRVKYLEQLRYEKNASEILIKFSELSSKFQGDLEVLLPYLKLACEVREWDIAERLSREILRENPQHPDALEGLRQCHIAREDWVSCIEQERVLLIKYGGSLFTEDLANQHENHLQKAIFQDPHCLKNSSFSYLPKKRDRKNDKKLEVFGKINQLKKSGLYIEAGLFLKEAFEKDASAELLDKLEDIYFESGEDEQILGIFETFHISRKKSIPVSLMFAKLLYKNDKFDEAKKILSEFQSNGNTLNYKNKSIKEKDLVIMKNERWTNLFHALRFFIAIRQDRFEDALVDAKPLLREDKLI